MLYFRAESMIEGKAMEAQKNELKKLKSAYKKARLLPGEGDSAALERQLRDLLGETGWAEFAKSVDAFLEKVRQLGEEVREKTRAGHIMVAAALKPYLKDAQVLGGGAQKYIQEIFGKAVEEREAVRAVQPKPVQPPAPIFYPSLPRDWLPQAYFKYGPVPHDKRFGVAMNDFCMTSLWKDGEQKTERLRAVLDQARQFARDARQFDEAMTRASDWLEFAVPVAREAERREEDSEEEAEIIRKLGEPLCAYIKRQRRRAREHVESCEARLAHVVDIRGIDGGAAAPTAVMLPSDTTLAADCTMLALTSHPNDITTLAPGNSWTVYIDESYSGRDDEFETDGDGIMAGVICRDDNPLPPIPALHCSQDFTEDRLKEQDKALEEILHHKNCGVLAIPSSAYDVAMGWDDTLASWVDIVVRLLPFPDGDVRVSLRICVEPHDPYRTLQDIRALKLVCEKSLKESFPERARRVVLSFEMLPKPKDGELSCNAYPDIVGFTCFRRGKDNTARQRYAASGWSGVCHLDLPPERVSRLLRCFFRREPLDAAMWTSLVSGGDIGIVGALSARFGERAKASAGEWERYLAFVRDHLASGAVDMKALRRQVDWLRRFLPQDVSKKSQLAWLTAQIALSNHEGRVAAESGSQMRAEFDALCCGLFDEAAPLVCDATLNLAVAYTNCYQFEMALALIQSLLVKDIATVGLSGRGKLLSTAGQHFAFLGMTSEAIDSFRAALDCFARLSDDRERGINLDITRAYLATATMDGRPSDALAAMSLYLLGDEKASMDALVLEARRLAAEQTAKFHHHILLRYIASRSADDPMRSAYCSQRQEWCAPAVGHPWELVEFYRAMLLPAGPERARRLESAYRIALLEGGETLMVIAAVVAGAALADGLAGEWPDRFARMVDGVKDMSGLTEQGRLQALLDQPTAKAPPLELAAKVLPFNFR